MKIIDIINNRHSYRGKYKPISVPREDLITIMQAGLNAPSGCNKQTTSLIAVDDKDILQKLHNVINPPVGETAPAIICVLTQRINAYRDKCFAVQDYSAAIENMLLALVELGYQSCWYEGHITDEDVFFLNRSTKNGFHRTANLTEPMGSFFTFFGFLSLQKFFLLCCISFRLFKAFLLFLFHFKHSCFITFC